MVSIKLSSAETMAYDALAFPVWLFSPETLRILASNRAAQNWLGYDAETLHAMTIADIRPCDDRDHISERVRQFDGMETDAGVWTVVSSFGERYKASFNWRRVEFEGADAVVVSIRDITQIAATQTQVETQTTEVEALRSRTALSRDQLASLVEDLPDNPDEPDADGAHNLYTSLRRVEALHVTDVMNLQRYPVRKPDGSFEERFWLPRNKPVFDASGHLIYITHRVEDVTEYLRLAESGRADSPWLNNEDTEGATLMAEAQSVLHALAQRDTRLRAAERLLDLGTWEYDLERGTLNWSQRTFDMFGVPEHRGAPDFDGYTALVHPDDRLSMLATFRRFDVTGAKEIEFKHRIVRADGSVAHVRGVGARHRIEDRETVIGVVQDVTGFMRTQQQLEEAGRLQRLAGYMARLGSWRADLASGRVSWSPETAEIHDAPAEMSPTLDGVIEYYIPKDRESVRALFEACASKGKPFDDVFQIVTAKGRRAWVRVIGSAVHDDADRIIAVEGAFQDVTEIVDFKVESQRLTDQLRNVLEGMTDGFYMLDGDSRFTYANEHAARMLGQSREALEGAVFWDMFPEVRGTAFETMFRQARERGTSQRLTEYYAPFERWFEVSVHPGAGGMGVYFRDVTEERRAAQQRYLLEKAIRELNEVVLITEAEPVTAPEGPRITYVNDAITALNGYRPEEVINRTPRLFQGPETEGLELARLRAAIAKKQPTKVELVNYGRNGEPYWIELHLSPVTDTHGVCTHFLSIQRNITERKKIEDALLTAATHDDLTGLFNRKAFRDALCTRLEEVEHKAGSLALFFIDLDQFKDVNDTLGHEYGDRVLVEAARRIMRVAGKDAVVARISGDEFTVLVSDTSPDDALALAQRLLDAFRRPFKLRGARASLTASVGLALAPDDSAGSEALMRDADIALYQSKAAGRNTFQRVSPSLRAAAARRIGIEQALLKSLRTDNDDFWLVYQPQFTCDADRRVVGAEALLRWKGPETGPVGPGEFIPIAEAMGMARPLDQRVIALAARQVAAWAEAGGAVPVSVNVSAISMQTEGFAQDVLQCLDEHKVPRSLFQIEIVETAYLNATSTTQDNLVMLSQAGIVMSIDDFGTGHSSLDYLRRLPVRFLKMDRSFVSGVGVGSQSDDALGEAILAMGRALNMQVIAEGVETEVQFDWLAQKGCSQVQGFLTRRPVMPKDFEAEYVRQIC